MKRILPMLSLAAVLCGCASGSHWKGAAFAFAVPDDPPTPKGTERITELSRVSISPVFQSRSFTYRTGEDSFEQDPYAGFLISPERALAESIRAWMRSGGVFGRVLDPGSGITPNLIVEVSITDLYGDFRKPLQPVGNMALHMICYQVQNGTPQQVVFDRFCSHETPFVGKTPGALMGAWDADLREIMNQINSEYAKTSSNGR